MAIFGDLSSTPGGDRDMRPVSFFVGNLIPNNFYLKGFFDMTYIWCNYSALKCI